MPNLDIEILRDQAKTYGVSVGKIESLIRNGYSQNYAYLIKKPTDQYQVIVEIADKDREHPEDLSKLYLRSDDGLRLVPLNAGHEVDPVARPAVSQSPQSVHERDVLLQPQARRAAGRRPPTTSASPPPRRCRSPSAAICRRGARIQKTVGSLVILMVLAVFVMYVILGILYESYLHRSRCSVHCRSRW